MVISLQNRSHARQLSHPTFPLVLLDVRRRATCHRVVRVGVVDHVGSRVKISRQVVRHGLDAPPGICIPRSADDGCQPGEGELVDDPLQVGTLADDVDQHAPVAGIQHDPLRPFRQCLAVVFRKRRGVAGQDGGDHEVSACSSLFASARR